MSANMIVDLTQLCGRVNEKLASLTNPTVTEDHRKSVLSLIGGVVGVDPQDGPEKLTENIIETQQAVLDFQSRCLRSLEKAINASDRSALLDANSHLALLGTLVENLYLLKSGSWPTRPGEDFSDSY